MKTVFSALVTLFGLTVYAQTLNTPLPPTQTPTRCDFEINERFKQANPHLAKQIEADELFLENLEVKQHKNSARSNYIIPVVFHILHDFGNENISDEQIHDAMRVLNEDFNKQNADTIDVVSAFKNIIGNTGIEFRLARKDPSGNSTTGINRIATQETYVGDDGSKVNQWPRNKYLNIWVVKQIQSGAAGYTYRPSTVNNYPSGDGIIVLHTYVGSIGTGNYNRSRTLTHEIGHWLNLAHTWGNSNSPGLSSNCQGDDGVGDTPNTIGWTTCSLNGTTCNSLDNVQNFMEYSYCDRMFTKGQSNRMIAALTSPIAQRNNLITEANLTETGVNELIAANFSASQSVVCVGTPVTFTDLSQYNQSSWVWTFTGANLQTSTQQNPQVIFYESGLQDIKLSVSDGNKTLSANKLQYIMVIPEIGQHVPFKQDFEQASIPSAEVYPISRSEDGNYFQISGSVGNGSSKSIWLHNHAQPAGNVDEFILGAVDVAPLRSLNLTFSVAYTRTTNSDNDALRIYSSRDCGKTWTLKYTGLASVIQSAPNQATFFTPNSEADWKTISVNTFSPLDLAAENLLIKFEFTSGFGNNIYIDNINFDGNYKTSPVLEWPKNEEKNVANNIKINWKAVRDVDSYQYQVDVTNQFNSTSLIQGNTNYISENPNLLDTEFPLSNLNLNTTYYWRVRYIKDGQPSAWSQTWNFTVSETGVYVNKYANKTLSFGVSPNPANEMVHINLTTPIILPSSHINFYDLQGRLVLSKNVGALPNGRHNVGINVNNLNTGVYLVTFETNAHILKQLLVIE